MRLGIGIATYQRHDGTTPAYLTRALKSIQAQTHEDYKVFLIGDHYENDDEFQKLSELIPEKKIFKKNLPVAVERSKYGINSQILWHCGGINAYNTAIKQSLDEGFDYLCHLDHDDYWESDHLSLINQVIESEKNVACVYTCSSYLKNRYLPNVELNNGLYFSYPIPVNVIHSSVCINHRKVPLLYRNVFEETGTSLEADIDMWKRLKEYGEKNSLNSYLIARLTCHHPEEKLSVL